MKTDAEIWIKAVDKVINLKCKLDPVGSLNGEHKLVGIDWNINL